MYPLETIMERAAASLSGATRPLIEAELFALLVDFCKQTRAWRQEFSGESTANQMLNLRALAAPGEVLGIVGDISLRGQWFVKPLAERTRLIRSEPAGKSPMHYYTQPGDPSEVYFQPQPGEELDEMAFEVYLAPLPTSLQSFPGHLVTRYGEALLAGLKGRMMLVPKKPYSDSKLGADLMSEYRQGSNQARHQVNKGFTTAPETWRYPGWA